ncbi:hypothetical protein SAMN05428976_102374 [Clostridium sp. USBA 49]|jgi:hypothetical protein|uniref:hypothetical protein n=1 Tax=Clostridium TaxID=1485 RepID=UPI00099974FB|nr:MULTISPECIES: hypothetical protein [Clostridium]SKA76862.1 hypothetical protein SAMN05428976_102374 [Clostridium sp. USBA 49]
MFWNKKIKKGYILLYTIIITTFCMCIVLYFFTLEFKKIKSIQSEKNYILMNNKYDEYKEKSLTILYQNILENVLEKNYENIKKYFQDSKINFYIDNGKCNFKYNEKDNNLILDTYIDDYFFKRDIYDYDFIDDKFKFIYKETIYIEGRIK